MLSRLREKLLPQNFQQWAVPTIFLLGFLLAITNVLMVRENSKLHGQIDFYDSMLHTREGIKYPTLRGKDLNGSEITVQFPYPRETVMFVFSPLCRYCRANWPKWTELAKGCLDKRVVFVNIKGTLSPRFFIKQPVVAGALMAQADAQSILDYEFRETPDTILLDLNGNVQKVWRGAIADRDFPEIKRVLDWRQPG